MAPSRAAIDGVFMKSGVGVVIGLSGLLLCGCAAGEAEEPIVNPVTATQNDGLDGISESYVRLVLAMGRHDADYVDAYYGPPEWKQEAEAESLTRAEIRTRATALRAALDDAPPAETDRMLQLRHNFLGRQIDSLIARVDMLQGKKLSFDEESMALYDAVSPRHDEQHFQAILERLDALMPGSGPLHQRYDEYRKTFAIPSERVDAVFQAAIEECRRRTEQFIDLPEGEDFVLEYVTDKSWGGYNWYQGDYHSLIQVNRDLTIYIDRALDLACHEGYPGHHVRVLRLSAVQPSVPDRGRDRQLRRRYRLPRR
jgi:hypothetical protein